MNTGSVGGTRSGPLASPPKSYGLSATLSRYIARRVAVAILLTALILAALIFLIDAVELLREATGDSASPLLSAAQRGLLRLPHLSLQLLSFAVLFGAMIGYHRLTRSLELIAARAAGISVWQFLLPGIGVALTAGTLTVTALHPVAASLYAKYLRSDGLVFGASAGIVSVQQGGLWLRQAIPTGENGTYDSTDSDPTAGTDLAADEGGEVIITARRLETDPLQLRDVTLFRLSSQGNFVERIDAPLAVADGAIWRLQEAERLDRDGRISPLTSDATLPQGVNVESLLQSLSPPETVSFWRLPDYIDILDDLGFPSRQHRVYYQRLLAQPVLFAALVLIGATFSLRFVRGGGTSQLILIGIVTGFGLYVLSDIVFAVGSAGRLPIPLAAWAPALLGLMVGISVLLYGEDG